MGSKTSKFALPLSRISKPMMVKECPGYLIFIRCDISLIDKEQGVVPWCWRYIGGKVVSTTLSPPSKEQAGRKYSATFMYRPS